MKMIDIENWNSAPELIDFLADRLSSGHILPFLGSGVSYFAELPKWKTLLSDVAQGKDPSYSYKEGTDPYVNAELVLQGLYKGDRQAFYSAIHATLYNDVDSDKLSSMIQADKGMRALTMLCYRSVRGGSRFIFTLNYDDILEILLRDLSLVVQSVGDHRFFFGDYDVSVLHPHGLLSIDTRDSSIDRQIVVAQSDVRAVSDTSWKPLIEILLAKSFPIFIGIGGEDIRLLDYLDNALATNYLHAVKDLPYVGVRLCSRGDESIPMFESKKIKCIAFANLKDEWPKFVEAICKKSAAKAHSRLEQF